MKKFFLILLINAPFLLNNTIKADTSQLFTLFDIHYCPIKVETYVLMQVIIAMK